MSGDPVDISVLIPVYNESEGIERCHREVSAVLTGSGHSYEIVFVDDGSTDDSATKLARIAESDRAVTLVKLAYNVGQQRAMFAALSHCGGRAVITYDADLQFHPECIPALAQKVLAGFDIVGGIRESRHDPLLRNRIPSWIGQQLINRALRIQQQDFGAVKAYSARLVRLLLGTNAPLVVIPAMAYSLTRNWIEIPVRHQARTFGESKWSISARMETYLDIYTLYARRPFEWMLVGAAACIALTFVFGIAILWKMATATQPSSGLLIFFDAFLFVTGIFLFVVSLIGEFVVRGLRGNRFDPTRATQEVVRSDK